MPQAFTWNADSDAGRRRLDLLEQLLACFQEALGHKVRNQLITVVAHANQVERVASERLDAETCGTLHRAVAVARETSAFVQRLADLGRLCRDSEPAIPIDLAAEVREAAAVVKLLNRQQQIEYHLQEKMPALHLPRWPLHLALVHLLRQAAEQAGATGANALSVTAETQAERVALHVAFAGGCLSEDDLAFLIQRMTSGAVAAEQGLDWFVVRQAAALWGGGVSVQSAPERGTIFTLWFSNPQPC